MKKLKKIISVILVLSILSAFVVILASCNEEDDSNAGKQEIVLSYYTGEFGEDWIKGLAKKWSDANDKYYISVKGNLNLSSVISADIKSGTQYDIFISEDSNFTSLYRDAKLVDLSGLLNEKPDGESGKTIGEKIADKNTWMSLASYGDAVYAIPYNISPTGLIFDYDRFAENGWLFDKDGKLGGSNGVHPGKDGVEGTYDDGQPQNMAQFKAMCEKIRNSGTEVFLYMGANAADYVNNVAYAFLAQYLGEEDYEIFYRHDSKGKEIELWDGTKTVVTIEDGYKTFQMKGMKEMIQFISEYITNSNYIGDEVLNDVSLTVDASHTKFITSGGPAFIIEGNWFENGSRQLIDGLGRYDPDAKPYGTHNYRYMMVPASEEGKSVMFSQTGGAIVVPKKDDAEKEAAILDFLKFMLSDENMGNVTRDSGMIWNYSYDIPEAARAEMTLFTKNTYEMVHDSENVIIRSAFIDATSTPIYAYSAMGTYTLATLNLSTQQAYVPALVQNSGGNVQTLLDSIKSYNSAERWSTWLGQAKSYGYYQ